MNLKDLQKEIAFQWRVQSFSRYKAQATCVGYIDARAVEDLLDEVCGPENWQCEYYQVKNTMCCKIGIRVWQSNPDGNDWVWKSDGGTESDVEKEKGELSDAFKRAAVKWGIGRFLYALPMKYLPANEMKVDGRTPHVVNNNGQRVWDITAHINGGDAAQGHPAPVFRAKDVTPPITQTNAIDTIYGQVGYTTPSAVNKGIGEAQPSPDEMAALFDQAKEMFKGPTPKHQDNPPQGQASVCPECQSTMAYRVGTSKTTGKPWSGWFCPTQGHKPLFDKTK